MFTIREYFSIILALPVPAYLRLVDVYNAGKMKNEKAKIALEIILNLPDED